MSYMTGHHGAVELVFGLVGVAGLLVTLGAWWWSVRAHRNDRRLGAVGETQSAPEAELVQRQLARARVEDEQRQREQAAAKEAARKLAAAAKEARVGAVVDYRPSAEAGWVLTAGVGNNGPCDARQVTYDVEPAVDVWPRCTAGPYSAPVIPVGDRYVNDLQLFWPEQVAITVEWTDGLGTHRQRFEVTLPERPPDPRHSSMFGKQ
jgi:hypothetical protein